MSSCRTTSDNFYSCCPAKMSDGRMFTDYRPSCTVNNNLRSQNNSENSYEYRQFLIRNADKLMNVNQSYLNNKNSCDSKPGQLPDFHTVCRYDKRCGGCYLNNSCGVGVKNEGLAPN